MLRNSLDLLEIVRCLIGTEFSSVRANGSPMSSGGIASGPVSVMNMVNEIGHYVKCGGNRRSALLSQLHWQHKDVDELINAKQLTPKQKAKREVDYNYRVPLDNTNVSIRLDDAFFVALDRGDVTALEVFNRVLDNAIDYGEPGFLINTGKYSLDILTNACGEYRTSKPNQICNLSSVNMAAIDTVEEFEEVVALATIFMMCGRERVRLPFEGANTDNIGLGIMGLHSWLIKRGYPYDINEELLQWLSVYERQSTSMANTYANSFGVQRPTRVRCIAPSGTISQLTGISGYHATSGIEPVFCKAYVRRWQDKSALQEDVVIEPLAQYERDGYTLDDSYSLASSMKGIETRLNLLATVQEYVDQAISITINLPEYAHEHTYKANLKYLIADYLPRLRGLTLYRDNSRGLSPITPISFPDDKHKSTHVYSDSICPSGVCGI